MSNARDVFIDMQIKKKNGFNIQMILDKLSKSRTIQSDNSIRISGFGVMEEIESFLRTAIVSEGSTDAFIRKVVKKAARAEQDLTEHTFLLHCNRISNTMLRQDQRKFKVVFPIWGCGGLLSGRRRWGNVWVAFDVKQSTSFARRAKKDREEQLRKRQSNHLRVTDDFSDLPLAVCSLQAVDVHDAFEKAEHEISKELGLYSLITSRGQSIMGTFSDKPVNTVLLAPHMTVHEPSGAIAADIYWHNSWPSQFTAKNRTDDEIKKKLQNIKMVRGRLQKLPWRGRAELALARHYSAFGQCDLEASFLDGWRLLEAIAGSPREKSETLIKRAAWFFEERDYYYQIGLHLMERRNLLSHGRPVKDESYEGLAFQMRDFVTPFLHAFLTNPFNFENVEEFWKFCDLPTDKRVRDRQAHLLECSSRFRQDR